MSNARLRSRLLIPVIAAAACLAAGPLFAGGWGPYFSWSHAIPNTGIPGFLQDEALLQAKNTGLFTNAQLNTLRASLEAASLTYELDHFSFGAIYDSAPARDQLWNIRLSMGVNFAVNGKITGTPEVITGNPTVDAIAAPYIRQGIGYVGSLLDTTGYGGTFTFTFGLSPVRNDLMKWWVGPCVRINGNYYPLDVSVPTFGTLQHGGSVALGGGIETGVNFHVTPSLSLGLTGGFLWNAYGIGAAVENSVGDVSSGSFFWGDGPMFLLQVSALFHTGEDRDAAH